MDKILKYFLLLFLLYADVKCENCGHRVFNRIYSNDENFPMIAKIYEIKAINKMEIKQVFKCNAVVVDKRKLVADQNCDLDKNHDSIEVVIQIPTTTKKLEFPIIRIKFENFVTFNKFHLEDVYVLELVNDIPDEFFYFPHCFLKYFRSRNEKSIAKESDQRRCRSVEKFHVKDQHDTKVIQMAFKKSNGREITEGAFYTRVNKDWFLYGLYYSYNPPTYNCQNVKGISIFKNLERFFKCSKKSVTKIFGTLANQIYCPGDVIFQDNFDSKNIDTNKWKYENTLRGGGNWEFQWYSKDPKNTFTKDGILHFHPTLTNDTGVDIEKGEVRIPSSECTDDRQYGCYREGSGNVINPIRSGSLTTIDSFSFIHGEIEVRAKIAAGDWLSSVISLEAKSHFYVTWPYIGQIGILEARGNREYGSGKLNIGAEQAACKIQFAEDWSMQFRTWHNRRGFHKDFHTFKLIWTPDNIKIYHEGDSDYCFVESGIYEKYKQQLASEADQKSENPWAAGTKFAPFDKEFYLSMSLKAGGIRFYPDISETEKVVNKPYEKPWNNEGGHASTEFWNARDLWLKTWKDDENDFEIDYVKITAI